MTPLAALLGKGARYSGDLQFEGRVRVDGQFTGRISTEDVLEIGESGSVEGQIDAATLIVSGTVSGKVQVSKLLRVTERGRVSGELDVRKIEVEAGAHIDARIRTTGR